MCVAVSPSDRTYSSSLKRPPRSFESCETRVRSITSSPMIAALVSFVLFSIGAIIPVIPFFFGAGWVAVGLSALCSSAGLFVVGAGITLLTGRNMVYGGVRQLVLGLLAAVGTYAIGAAIGGATGI